MPKKKSKVLRISTEIWEKLEKKRGDMSFSDYLSQLLILEEHLKQKSEQEAQDELSHPRCSKCRYNKTCMRPQHLDEGVIFEPCKDFQIAFPNFPDYCGYMIRLWDEGVVDCHRDSKKDDFSVEGIRIENPQVCWACMKLRKKKKWGISDSQHTCFNCHYYQNCHKNPSTNKLPMPADPTCESFRISPKRRGWRA